MLGGCSDTPGRVGAALRVWDACRGTGAGVCGCRQPRQLLRLRGVPLRKADVAERWSRLYWRFALVTANNSAPNQLPLRPLRLRCLYKHLAHLALCIQSIAAGTRRESGEDRRRGRPLDQDTRSERRTPGALPDADTGQII